MGLPLRYSLRSPVSVPVDVAAGDTPVTFAASSGTVSHTAKLSLTIVPCLTGGNEQTIQAALGSAAGFADLCPGAVFAVNGPIFMGSDNSTGNRLFTAGYPTQLAQKALIRVVDHTASWPSAEPNSMIWASGTDLRIQNIQLDGNRTN